METANAFAVLVLGGAIAADVVGTFVVEGAAVLHDRRRWIIALGAFLASLALFALALEEIPTAVAEALFAAVGSAAVAAIAARRGESITARKVVALAVLVLGVVVLQLGAHHG